MLEEKIVYNRLHKHFRNRPSFTFVALLFYLLPLSFPAYSAPSLFTDIPVVLLDATTEEPLIGVNIYTEDFRMAAVSDIDGKAVLKEVSYRDEVIFSYTGYKTQTLPVFKIRNLKGRILMEPDVLVLSGVEVVGRRDDPISEIPYKVERITNEAIQRSAAQTSADLLEKNAGLFVQKSQMGGGSPIIRGFEANRVLLVVDGVRMNNAIYRNGHLQNAITIDPAILEQAEVIYGPGSLTYGSDALGGVVHYRTKDPELAYGPNEDVVLKTNAGLRYAYANGEKSFHVDFNQGRKKWGTLTSFSIVDYDNLIAGSVRPEEYPRFGLKEFIPPENPTTTREKFRNPNPNQQWGTEYAQIDILQKIKYQLSDNVFFVANAQWSSSTDIPRYDNLADTVSSARDLKWREWFYGPQQRILGSLKARILNQKLFDRGTIIASFQRVDEDRKKRKWNKNWLNVSEVDVYVYSLTADFDKFLTEDERMTLSYGIDLSRNDVTSSAYEIYVHKGPQQGNLLLDGDDIITRYPSQGSSMDSYGAYGNFKWRSKDKVLAAEAGLRYSYVKIAGFFGADDPFQWPQNYIDGIRLNNDALTFGTGLTANTKDKWQFRALLASAFRSPNVDDFAQIREKNGFLSVPNPNLKPEEALTYELTVGKQFGTLKTNDKGEKYGTVLHLSATGFRTDLKNAMTRKNSTLPDGTNVIFRDEEQLEIQSNVNATTATIFGFSGNLSFKIGKNLELESNINYTKGTSRFQDEIEGIVIDTIVPFSHIPPLYGRTSLRFNLGKWIITPTVRYQGRKRPNDYAVASARIVNGEVVLRRDGTSDNIDYSPYGNIDANGDPCDPAEPRGISPCAPGYAGSLAWTTYNVYTEYQINDNFWLNLSIENIGDLHYRPFSSGVSGAGRNFIIGLRGSF
ncbi:MAG: TonB-dependent receptor [Bacteroidota bacterium]